MRLGLIVLLCVLTTGCAIVREDQNEPVDNGPRQEKAEPVLKPSEALKPKSLELASPITDHFYMRGTYFSAKVDTVLRVDPSDGTTGTTLSGEDDLGLDDKIDQGRMEFDIRMGEKGELWVVEVRTLGILAGQGTFVRAGVEAGYSYADLLARIVEVTRARAHPRTTQRASTERVPSRVRSSDVVGSR